MEPKLVIKVLLNKYNIFLILAKFWCINSQYNVISFK